MINENRLTAMSGWLPLGVLLPILPLAVLFFIAGAQDGSVGLILGSIGVVAIDVLCLAGLFVRQPKPGTRAPAFRQLCRHRA